MKAKIYYRRPDSTLPHNKWKYTVKTIEVSKNEPNHILQEFIKITRLPQFIKSGYCPDCQKALFGTEYDRSDFIIVDDIKDGEVPEDVKKFLEAAEKMNVKDVIKSETANILTTEHKVVLLSEFDLEDIFYVDDDGNIKDR